MAPSPLPQHVEHPPPESRCSGRLWGRTGPSPPAGDPPDLPRPSLPLPHPAPHPTLTMTLPLPVQQCRGQIPTPTCPQLPGGRRCTHPSGGLCGQRGPNAVAAVGSWVGSLLLPAGGGVCGQGSREGRTASARRACTRDDLPGLPTEPSVKSPGLRAMGRARTWGRRS